MNEAALLEDPILQDAGNPGPHFGNARRGNAAGQFADNGNRTRVERQDADGCWRHRAAFLCVSRQAGAEYQRQDKRTTQ